MEVYTKSFPTLTKEHGPFEGTEQKDVRRRLNGGKRKRIETNLTEEIPLEGSLYREGSGVGFPV